MPELPDIAVFSGNLNQIFAGKKLLKIKIVNGRKLPDKQAAFTKALAGKTLKSIYRAGKEMRFAFGNNILLGLHLMLTGDIFIFEKKNEKKSTVAELYFSGGKSIALTDRMGNANIRLNPVDKKGADALSADLNFKYLKTILQKRKSGIKSILIDQNVIRGIGNSYSDEILWQAKISPYAVANAIPDDKIKALIRITKKVLKAEIKNINKNFPGKVNGEVKDYLQIHTKNHTHSPTGAPIIIDKHGMMKTYYTSEQMMYE